jgi:hypothetical protein
LSEPRTDLPSLKQIDIVKFVQFHGKFYRRLKLTHNNFAFSGLVLHSCKKKRLLIGFLLEKYIFDVNCGNNGQMMFEIIALLVDKRDGATINISDVKNNKKLMSRFIVEKKRFGKFFGRRLNWKCYQRRKHETRNFRNFHGFSF